MREATRQDHGGGEREQVELLQTRTVPLEEVRAESEDAKAAAGMYLARGLVEQAIVRCLLLHQPPPRLPLDGLDKGELRGRSRFNVKRAQLVAHQDAGPTANVSDLLS